MQKFARKDLRVPLDDESHTAVKIYAAGQRVSVCQLVRALLAERIPELKKYEAPRDGQSLRA